MPCLVILGPLQDGHRRVLGQVYKLPGRLCKRLAVHPESEYRNRAIIRAHLDGKSLGQIGRTFGIHRSRVHQIVKKYGPKYGLVPRETSTPTQVSSVDASALS